MVARPEIVAGIPEVGVGVVAVVVGERTVGKGVVAKGVAGQTLPHPLHCHTTLVPHSVDGRVDVLSLTASDFVVVIFGDTVA